MEKEKIQLQLDLELAKKNLRDAQEELKTMGGNTLLTVCFAIFSFRPLNRVNSTQIDVHSENRELQAWLKNVISLDTMKQALERKDTKLPGAQKVVREKTEADEKKLASVGKLE